MNLKNTKFILFCVCIKEIIYMKCAGSFQYRSASQQKLIRWKTKTNPFPVPNGGDIGCRERFDSQPLDKKDSSYEANC